jgi:hypothetical protein
MRSTKKALMAALAVLAAGPALACFTVYDRNNQVLYNAQVPPVDMSKPLAETLPQKFPGGHMVFGNGTNCPIVQAAGQLRASPTAAGRSPLLTDVATARAMGLKHTVIADGVAMVQDRPENMRPGVVLAESGLPQQGPDTRMMGAGPARPAQQQQQQGQPPVITERNYAPTMPMQPGYRR